MFDNIKMPQGAILSHAFLVQIGDKMNLKVNREGKEIDITLTLQEQ